MGQHPALIFQRLVSKVTSFTVILLASLEDLVVRGSIEARVTSPIVSKLGTGTSLVTAHTTDTCMDTWFTVSYMRGEDAPRGTRRILMGIRVHGTAVHMSTVARPMPARQPRGTSTSNIVVRTALYCL